MTGSGTQTVTLVGGTLTSSTATNGEGGFARLIGANAVVTIGTATYQTTITSAKAGTNGGIFYFETTTASTLDIVNSVITTLRANGKGGLAYFDGTVNTAKINGATTVISDATFSTSGTLTGGLFYMNGATTNYIEVMTGAKITDVTTTNSGGLFYMNGQTQTLKLNNMQALRIYSQSEGGLLFSSTQTTSLTLNF